MEFDSEVEKRFAQELDKRKDIKVFVKLPLDTPIGPYNPDWAIVKHDEYGGHDKIFMVKETKRTISKEQLRISELAKIKFGQAHFDEIGVDYSWVKSAGEV